MNPLLLQLAMAALGQVMGGGGFGGGGFGGGGFGGGASPFPPQTPMPQRPLPQPPMERPVRAQAPSLQLATLAAATCQMRSGSLNRTQATSLLQQTGKAWGWETDWAMRIPLNRLDAAIRSAGGCTALLEQIRDNGEPSSAPATERAEGFGLSPYR